MMMMKKNYMHNARRRRKKTKKKSVNELKKARGYFRNIFRDLHEQQKEPVIGDFC